MSLPGHLDHLCDVLLKELHERGIPHAFGRDIDVGRKTAKKILEEIYQAFQSKETFRIKFNGDFGEFLNELTQKSYGLILDYTNPAAPKFVEAPPEQESFAKRVDLLSLIDYLMQNYPEKYVLYGGFKEERKINDELTLTAKSNDNFWDNIFNDYDSYQNNDTNRICIFNREKHSIASYLHSAHPHIHYLNVTADGFKTPLCTAILMEANGGKEERLQTPYLIVEGVVGNFGTLPEKERETIYGFTWKAIKEFAAKRKKTIFINTCHSGNEAEPEEFVEYVLRTEKKNVPDVNGSIVTTKSGKRKFKLEKPFAPQRIKDKDSEVWFTHYFVVPTHSTTSYSNRSKWEIKYDGEHYADTFFLYNKSKLPHKKISCPFFPLKGYAQGFEVRPILEEEIIASQLPHDTKVNLPIPVQNNEEDATTSLELMSKLPDPNLQSFAHQLFNQPEVEQSEGEGTAPKKRPWLAGVLSGALTFLVAYSLQTYVLGPKPDERSKVPLKAIAELQEHYKPMVESGKSCSKELSECKAQPVVGAPLREEKVLYDYKGRLLQEKVSFENEIRKRYIVESPESLRFVGAIFKPLKEEDGQEKDRFEKLVRDMKSCLGYESYKKHGKPEVLYWHEEEFKSTYRQMEKLCKPVKDEFKQELIRIVSQIDGCQSFTNSVGEWNPIIEVKENKKSSFQITCTLRYRYNHSCFSKDKYYVEHKKADLNEKEVVVVDIDTRNLCKIEVHPAHKITFQDELDKWESKDLTTLELWLSDQPGERKHYTLSERDAYRIKTLLGPFMEGCSGSDCYSPIRYKPIYEPNYKHNPGNYPGGGSDNSGGVG